MKIKASGIYPLTDQLTKIVLANANMYVEILNYGATIYGIYLPSKTNGFENVVLNYKDVTDYLTDPFYIGSTVGRFAGRISEGRLPVNGQTYQLTKNENGKHHLHGGYKGFNTKIFAVLEQMDLADKSMVKLRASSRDGEEGYPGNLALIVTYTLNAENLLTVEYEATCDQPTHVNITNHSYFNLCGANASALNQQLTIPATKMLETDSEHIPTGKKININNTPFDFNKAAAIGDQKNKLVEKMYNACYRLSKHDGHDAILFDAVSQRKMFLSSSYPSLLFYSGDYLSGQFHACDGICLEAQFNPDTPNQLNNLSTLLLPGKKYLQHIQLTFTW